MNSRFPAEEPWDLKFLEGWGGGGAFSEASLPSDHGTELPVSVTAGGESVIWFSVSP